MSETAEGTIGEGGDFQPVPEEPTPESNTDSSTTEQIAREVIAGRWGRGNNRKKRLEDAGYNVETVNAKITEILNQK